MGKPLVFPWLQEQSRLQCRHGLQALTMGTRSWGAWEENSAGPGLLAGRTSRATLSACTPDLLWPPARFSHHRAGGGGFKAQRNEDTCRVDTFQVADRWASVSFI